MSNENSKSWSIAWHQCHSRGNCEKWVVLLVFQNPFPLFPEKRTKLNNSMPHLLLTYLGQGRHPWALRTRHDGGMQQPVKEGGGGRIKQSNFIGVFSECQGCWCGIKKQRRTARETLLNRTPEQFCRFDCSRCNVCQHSWHITKWWPEKSSVKQITHPHSPTNRAETIGTEMVPATRACYRRAEEFPKLSKKISNLGKFSIYFQDFPICDNISAGYLKCQLQGGTAVMHCTAPLFCDFPSQ